MNLGNVPRRWVERVLARGVGALAVVALFTLMWMTVADAVGRKWFASPVTGALELTEIMMVLVLFGALPLVSWRDEHVMFTTFDHMIPPRWRRVQMCAVHLLCAATFALLGWLLFQRAERFFDFGETTAQLKIAIGPIAVLMGVLLWVAAAAHVLRAVAGPDEPTESGQGTGVDGTVT